MTATTVGPIPRDLQHPAGNALDAPRALGWLREPGMGASVLVAGVSTLFGVALLTASGFLGAMMTDVVAGDEWARLSRFLTIVLLGIALYAASIVTANTFSTVVAGRTRQIALLRLLGATARSQRFAIARQGFGVGLVGAVLGTIVGVALSFPAVALARHALDLTDVHYTVLKTSLLLPAAAVIATTFIAAWGGSKRVLQVSPPEALNGTVAASYEQLGKRKVRNTFAVLLLLGGGLFLALGVLIGLLSPLGVLVAFIGGVASFTGFVLGATLVIPPILRVVGWAFGPSVTARLAAENALRYPERSSKMSVGLITGITLVMMFANATATAKRIMAAEQDGELSAASAAAFDNFTAVVMGIVAIAGVIAAIGLVSLLTMGVLQRRRELGLLRALGLTRKQVRRVILLEATHITITSVILGLAFGVLYGWVGAESLLGSAAAPAGSPLLEHLVAPGMAVGPTIVVVVLATVLTLVAAAIPARHATAFAPVEALAE